MSIAEQFDKEYLEEVKDYFECANRFGFEPETKREKELYNPIQDVILEHGEGIHDLVEEVASEVASSEPQFNLIHEGLEIRLDKENYTDYMKEQELLPVYPVGYDKPLFYYEVKVDDIKLTMEDRGLTGFEDSTLADVLTLTIPSQSFLNGSRVPNEFIRGSDNYEELMEKLPVVSKDLTLELATYVSDYAPFEERDGAFGVVPTIKGLAGNYFYSIVKDTYNKLSDDDLFVDEEKWLNDSIKAVKDDLNADYSDLISENAQEFYRSVNHVFNARNPYERYDIYKLSAGSSEKLKDNLMTVLTEKVLENAVDIDNQPLVKGSSKHKETVEKITNFLLETTVNDLMDEEVKFDIYSDKLEEGLPLLPLIAEYGNEFNIKFSDEIPKLSDLTRETVEVNR